MTRSLECLTLRSAALVGGLLALTGATSADIVDVGVFDDAEADYLAMSIGGDANGTVAISGMGDATADRGCLEVVVPLCASAGLAVIGDSSAPTECENLNYAICPVSASVLGSASGHTAFSAAGDCGDVRCISVEGDDDATARYVAASVGGNASSETIAVSLFQDAKGCSFRGCVALSGTGDAASCTVAGDCVAMSGSGNASACRHEGTCFSIAGLGDSNACYEASGCTGVSIAGRDAQSCQSGSGCLGVTAAGNDAAACRATFSCRGFALAVFGDSIACTFAEACAAVSVFGDATACTAGGICLAAAPAGNASSFVAVGGDNSRATNRLCSEMTGECYEGVAIALTGDAEGSVAVAPLGHADGVIEVSLCDVAGLSL